MYIYGLQLFWVFKVNKMKLVILILLIIALVIPASASSVVNWTQENIPGYNLTLNYTSGFNVAKDDILNISVKNIGNEAENDTITVYKIRVTDTSEADGLWTGSVNITPGTRETIDFELNVNTDDEETVNINLYYTVNHENKTLSIKAYYPGTPESPEIEPYITSWGNNKTNDDNLNLTINQSETVRFNFTASQTLTSWHWTLNGETISNPSDTLFRKFNNEGNYKVRTSGSNNNGSTQTILWKVTVKGTDERDEDDHNKINADIISWHPQVVDYIYVNGTISETIEYSITIAEPLTNVKWTEDGTVVDSDSIDSADNTYNYSITWDEGDLGFHTIAIKGANDAANEVEFRWYVNVYEINGIRGGNWFDVIDYSNVKVKMFKYKRAKYGSNSENTLNFVNRLHDSIATRQMTREALRDAFKSGELSVSEYVAALKQIQSDIKDELKIAKRMNDIEKGFEKEDEEEDRDNNYQSDRVKQNKVKEDNKKDRNGKNEKVEEEDDEDDD